MNFPLATVSQSDLHGLCRVLWGWQLCLDCINGERCTLQASNCPGRRLGRLDQFFKFYKNMTAMYGTFPDSFGNIILKDHNELFTIITELKDNPNATRKELRNKLSLHTSGADTTMLAGIEQAIDLAVRILFMIDCSSSRIPLVTVDHRTLLNTWTENDSLISFVGSIMPKSGNTCTGDDEHPSSESQKRLTAYQLKRRCSFTFEATNDLLSHLAINGNTVKIFHQVAYLKENLRVTKIGEQASQAGPSSHSNVPPRQLLLEVLDSIQLLLFRRSDAKSFAILRSLVSRSYFDPDCLKFESAGLRDSHEVENVYQHFSPRLEALMNELDDPRPSGSLETWLEEKSGARYVMMATLAGVVIAVLLGMAGLAVAIYQAWLGYQQWQHPVR